MSEEQRKPPEIEALDRIAASLQSDARVYRKMKIQGAIMAFIAVPLVVEGNHRIFGIPWLWSVVLTLVLFALALSFGFWIGKRMSAKHYGAVQEEIERLSARMQIAIAEASATDSASAAQNQSQ